MMAGLRPEGCGDNGGIHTRARAHARHVAYANRVHYYDYHTLSHQQRIIITVIIVSLQYFVKTGFLRAKT